MAGVQFALISQTGLVSTGVAVKSGVGEAITVAVELGIGINEAVAAA